MLMFLAVAAITGCGGGGGSNPSPPPPADTIAPTVPTGLTASNVTGTTADLAWEASTDNVTVTGYRIYRNSVLLQNSAGPSLTDTGLTPGTEYCYAISAYDASGNESARSPEVCITPANELPVAALDAPASGLIGVPLVFDASASTASSGELVSYDFDFGDGSAVWSLATPVAEYSFASLGTFSVTVTVTDSLSNQASITRPITIGLRTGEAVNISNSPFYSQSPSAVRMADGSIYVVWEERRDNIMFSRSLDGGASFDAPRYVIDPAGPWGSEDDYSSGQMQIFATSTDLHIAWTVFDLLFGAAEVFHLRSGDGGATFPDPVIVSPIDSYNSYGPTLSADDEGNVLIAWNDDDLAAGPLRGVRHSLSADSGDSFPATALIPDSAHWLCPTLLGTGVPAYLVAMQSVPQPETAIFVRSLDGAQSFSAPLPLDQVAEKSWCPQLAMDTAGTLYVAWEEGTAFADRKILFAASGDSGISFSDPVNLTTAFADSVCPSIATAGNGRVYVAWSTTSGTDLDESYLAISADSGQTFSSPLRIAVPAPDEGYQGCFHLLAGEDDRIGLVWNTLDTANSQAEIMYVGADVSPP